MRSPGINGEGELRGQSANPGSPGKIAIKMECVCVFHYSLFLSNALTLLVGRHKGYPACKKTGCWFVGCDDFLLLLLLLLSNEYY